MNIYISGISGTGMGPLALIAQDAGFFVSGSDLSEGHITPELQKKFINFHIGPQDGSFLESIHGSHPIDWFIHTSSLPQNHSELQKAKELGIKISKRDEFTAFLIKKLNLKLIAVAGTHGKTTTTSMLIWAVQKLGIKASHIVGTTLNFAPSGQYHVGDEFFIYEADEYDRNFLNFHPYLSIVTSISYDHPDIYRTKESYFKAFHQFESQSQQVIKGIKTPDQDLTLSGLIRRIDATYAMEALLKINPKLQKSQIIEVLNNFPGVGRRFEQIAPNLYSDYAHHPEEVAVTISMALEESIKKNLKGVVAIYQPHQNTRQHQVFSDYQNAFDGISQLYWLPTYLTREDPNLPILTPEDFIKSLSPSIRQVATTSNLDDNLASQIKEFLENQYLVILMTAGPADTWLRQNFSKTTT